MKLIKAVIRPAALDDVREKLTEIGIQGITVTEVRGYGRQKGQTELYRGAEYNIEFVPKLLLEIALTDEKLDLAVDVICSAAQSGKIGDGKIFVSELQSALRIRTQETDQDAL